MLATLYSAGMAGLVLAGVSLVASAIVVVIESREKGRHVEHF